MVTQIGFAGGRVELLQMFDRGVLGMQLFQLVLGKITDARVLVLFAVARLRLDHARDQFNQSRFARAIGAEQADAIARPDGHIDIVEYDCVCIAGAHRFQFDQSTGAFFRLAQFEMERRIDVRGADQLHAFQRLDAALCLFCLGGLGAETLDIGFDVRDFALLFVVLAPAGWQGVPRECVRRPNNCRDTA